MIGPLLMGIFGWVAYFLIVFLCCHWFYKRLSGPEPNSDTPPVIIQGRSVTAKLFWERRAKRLQRIFIIIAVLLMVLPLFLPFVLPPPRF